MQIRSYGQLDHHSEANMRHELTCTIIWENAPKVARHAAVFFYARLMALSPVKCRTGLPVVTRNYMQAYLLKILAGKEFYFLILFVSAWLISITSILCNLQVNNSYILVFL